jgi:hypothetical protein
MKFISTILLSTCLLVSYLASAADGPQSFDKFFKKTMKVIPGIFPVYQDGNKYYLEIPKRELDQDILVVGDIARGFANEVSQSSGVIRITMGDNQNLNVIRQIYKEVASADLNPGMEKLIQQSNLIPVSSVIHIEAKGKSENSYIIDITKELMEGGDLFSFKDFSGLSRSDASRSGVQSVNASSDGVVFSVLRTQTDKGQATGGKTADKANAYMLNLGFQRLPRQMMAVREFDPRIGFGTVSYNDFGKNPYGVREVKVIKKWDLSVPKVDQTKYKNGVLVAPERPIHVFIDDSTPRVYLPYLKAAVNSWNDAFAVAGFKNVFIMSNNAQDNYLSSGKILIKWGNAYDRVVKTILEDPRTGEILAAKMNVSDYIADGLIPAYFVACGLKDNRVLKNLKDVSVKGEILSWKIKQAFGEIMGMQPNLYASTAYTTKQIRSASFLMKNSFTSSVTDDNLFNYVVQPHDQVPPSGLIGGISVYDKMAINWAYRIYPNEQELKKATKSISYQNTALRFVEENKNDPFTQHANLASDQIEAAELGLKNMEVLYPQIEKITSQMPGGDEDWTDYLSLVSAFQTAYDNHMTNVAALIGGRSLRSVIKGYNEVPVEYVPKDEQQKAFIFLDRYLFEGVPDWMDSRRLRMTNSELIEVKLQRTAEKVLAKMINTTFLSNLIKAENDKGKSVFTAGDLFKNLDHFIFKDFDPSKPVDAYGKLLQSTLVYNLTQAAAKDSFTSGLTDANEVLHLYFMQTIENVIRMSKTHQDASVRANYKLMKMKIDQEYFQNNKN